MFLSQSKNLSATFAVRAITLTAVLALSTASYASTAPWQHQFASVCSFEKIRSVACQKFMQRHHKEISHYMASLPKATPAQMKAQLAKIHALGQQLIAEEKAKAEKQGTSNATPVTGRGLPNVSLASPNAFGGKGTSVFAGLTYVNHWDGTTKSDGSGSVGVAFGDPFKYVGASLNVGIDSLGFRSDPFAANGSVGFRLNRYVTQSTAVAVGAGNPAGWGAQRKLATSYYFDVTQGISTYLPITLNVGTGTGAFYSTASAQANRDDQYGIFGGVGITVLPGLSLIVDDASRELNTGATYVFNYKKASFFVTAAGMNVARYQNFDPHFMATGGMSYQLSS